jgi:hypothetical protein
MVAVSAIPVIGYCAKCLLRIFRKSKESHK